MRLNAILGALCAAIILMLAGCDLPQQEQPVSSSGVKKAEAQVDVQANGLTVEQDNIKRRLQLENKPGSIKHLYVFSAYSGQCIMYSTVQGKVTSSGKRLSPTTVAALEGQYIGATHEGMTVTIGGKEYSTAEVLQDDGTYGSSSEYLYWFDSRGVYHQLYVSGGTLVTVSDQPMSVHSVTLNIEQQAGQ